MSSAVLTSDSPQSFREEVLDRTAEQAPAWGLPRIQAGQHQAAILQQARERAQDARRLECIANGLGDPGPMEPMGDTYIIGDIKCDNPNAKIVLGKNEITTTPTAPDANTPTETPTDTGTPTATTPDKPGVIGWAGPLLLAAVGGGSLLAGMAVNHIFNRPDTHPPAANDVDANWKLGVQVKPHGQ